MSIEINLPELHAGQRTVVSEAARFNVLAAGRRWGKNVLAEEKLIETAFEGHKPVAMFNSTYKSLQDAWRRFCDTLAPIIVGKSEKEYRLELLGGGSIDLWSLDRPETIRGRAYARVVIDEAASVADMQHTWETIIRPELTDYRGDAWFISTPHGFNDFYELWKRGQDAHRSAWRSWRRPSLENPVIPDGEIADAQDELSAVAFRQEYEAEFLAGGIGQYFNEWDPAIHLCEMPGTIPSSWRKLGMIDYGHATRFCYLQAAYGPDGQLLVYRELYTTRIPDSTQAGQIADLCRDDPPEYIAYPSDMEVWSGHGVRGESHLSTYKEVWAKCGFRVDTKVVNTTHENRISGAARIRELLKPFPGPDGRPTARLQIVRDGCPNLIRTLPQLHHDEKNPEDVDTTDEDHAYDALRHGIVSRPVSKPIPPVNPPSDFDARAAYKMIEDRRKRMKYIGGEIELARVGRL